MSTPENPDSRELSVVIPAFNEALRIESTVKAVLAYLEQRAIDFEVVVVDDGSQDATTAVVEVISDPRLRLVRLATNQGKGAALRAGVLTTGSRWVLLSDADLSAPIEEFGKLYERSEDAELIFGSRAVADAQIALRQPMHRELMGRTFNMVLRVLGLTRMHDTQCGFKLIRGDVARELFEGMSIARFAYDVELVWMAGGRGYRVIEVGVVWRDSAASRVRPLRDAARMLWDVLRLRLRRR